MNEVASHYTDTFGNPIPVRPIQRHLARVGLAGAIVLLICPLFFGGTEVSVAVNGDSIVYTAKSRVVLMFLAFPVLTGILAIVYSLQPGIFRIFGVALGAITVWLVYAAVTLDTSNHNVTLTATAVCREVGTKSEPVRQTIEFARTAYLCVVQVPSAHGPQYELVARAATDGAETRILICDMMRAALPRIMEAASKHNVIIGESADGSVIPVALRVETDK